MDLKLLISRIMEKSELTEEEVKHNLELKQKEFQNLISEEAAARLIARELGISVEETEEVEFLTLSEIKSQKPTEANTIVRIMAVYSPKEFQTERKRGKVCNIEIADSTSRGVLVLWDEDVRWLELNAIEKNDVLLIRNGQIKSYNPFEMHSSLLTELQPMKPQEFGESKYRKYLPLSPTRLSDPGSLKEGEIVDLFARVNQISELREFAREKGSGKVLNILITDSKGKQIPLVLWDYYASKAERALKIGNAIKLENAIVKKGPELHLNWASHLIIEPKNHNLKTEEELLKDTLPSVRILDLKTGERGIVKAYLSKISKLRKEGDVLIAEAEIRDEISVPVDFHGKNALDIMQIRHVPKISLELLLKLKEEYLKGKRVSLVASKGKDGKAQIARYRCESVLYFS